VPAAVAGSADDAMLRALPPSPRIPAGGSARGQQQSRQDLAAIPNPPPPQEQSSAGDPLAREREAIQVLQQEYQLKLTSMEATIEARVQARLQEERSKSRPDGTSFVLGQSYHV
jgi:hypothetical protein